ncbi:MAG: HAMP domain-containing protein, partial [Paracoccaceae bacterium]|nr:HAMP domain-containing protein [Paracoccaceae bacterium]
MRSVAHRTAWDQLVRLRRQRRFQNAVTLGLTVLGPVLAVATFVVLGPMGQGADSTGLRLILLADFIYFLLLAGLIVMRLVQMLAARRAQASGSRLTLRLTGVFAGIALVPTVLVALFAGLTVNIGLEGWFSDRVREVVGTSLTAAEAYQDEHRRDLIADAEALAGFLNLRRQAATFMSDGDLRELLVAGQAGVQRGLKEAYVIDGTGEIVARGERSYLFDYEKPSPEKIVEAQKGATALIEDWDNSEFRALIQLDAFVDRYLYISRTVDGKILSLLDDTRQTVSLYQQLETSRGRVLFEFGLVYVGFALILILAAVWIGLWFAERLSRPIGRLAAAAERVGAGDLDARVIEAEGDDEIATLGASFNRMTRQLKGQREALVESHRETEERRRLFDSVLSSVTSGVVGLDAA